MLKKELLGWLGVLIVFFVLIVAPSINYTADIVPNIIKPVDVKSQLVQYVILGLIPLLKH